MNEDKLPMKLSDNPAWKGYKGMPYSWFSKYFERGGRKRQGGITIEDMHIMWLVQGGRCNLSRLKLHWGRLEDGTYDISIDRIDSSKEYVEGNVQLVHKDVNLMKNAFKQEYFIAVCCKIYGNCWDLPKEEL